MKVSELADMVGGVFSGDAEREIHGVASLNEAGPDDVSFFHNARYLQQLKSTKAGAVLVPAGLESLPDGPCFLTVENPSAAFARLVGHFSPPRRAVKWGVDPRACIAETAVLDPSKVFVGPGAVIEEDVVIGSGTRIGSNASIGAGTRIGSDCTIHPNVVIYHDCRIGDRVILHSSAVIGADGFGFDMVDGRHVKIPQVGIVQIDSDVEIGAGTTIDRARFGRTWIGEGTKIDNLIMIGHNCVIGKHCILVGMCGIAGSTVLGDYVTVAAQAGIAGHLRIGDRVVIAAQAGVMNDLSEPGYYMGFPARPMNVAKRELVALRRLPEMMFSKGRKQTDGNE